MGKFTWLLPFAAALVLVGGASAAPGSGGLANGGFEADGTGVATPSGWHDLGKDGASFTEAGGHSGGFRLSHWSPDAYTVTTVQVVTGLARADAYTLGAWVKRSTGDNRSSIALTCGGLPQTTQVPAGFASEWLHIVVSAPAHGRTCIVALTSIAAAGEWSNYDDVTLTPGAATLSVLGADVSSLKKSEDLGGVYRDSFGRRADALRVLRDHGLNWIRLRAWVDPADHYHDTAELLTMAKRAKALGIKVLVDLHYSDFWADPGKQ